MITRYFMLNGIPHESKNGRWCEWEEVLVGVDQLQTQIDGLSELLEKAKAEIKRLELLLTPRMPTEGTRKTNGEIY